MLDKIKKDIYEYRFSIIAILIYIIFMQLIFKSVCPIKAIFGVECPGCGLTHATIYLLTGKFYEAITTNFTVLLWWGLILIFIFNRYIYKERIKIIPVLFFIVGIITIVRYICL